MPEHASANACFGCGPANPRGLHLRFEDDASGARARVRMDPAYQGAPGWLHGGMIALLLDEAMAKLNRRAGEAAVTAELRVEYLRPVPTAADLLVSAEEIHREGRSRLRRAEIRLAADGEILARGEGRFVVPRELER